MNTDLIWLTAITLWIILCSGNPDMIDAMVMKTIGTNCNYEIPR